MIDTGTSKIEGNFPRNCYFMGKFFALRYFSSAEQNEMKSTLAEIGDIVYSICIFENFKVVFVLLIFSQISFFENLIILRTVTELY
jgi:hypothetical protein